MDGKIVTVGTFDGVHRGHQAVLSTLLAEGKQRGLSPLVITFDRHPLEIIMPARAPRLLMAPDSRDRIIRETGAEVMRLSFTESLRGMTASEWMRELRDVYNARIIVLGYDNTFGSDGAGLGADDFREIGREVGLDVLVAPEIDGCSSSAIRNAVGLGATDEAEAMLGRPFSISGKVIHGRQLGRTIGVPTANVELGMRQMLPLNGVYAATVDTRQGTYPAVVNVGHAPTVTDDSPLSVEAHLLDFDGDLYGECVEVRFGPRIREERKFASLEALRSQIARDIGYVRSL